MSELLALSRLFDKPIQSMTLLEKRILQASVIDEDLANKAAQCLELGDEDCTRHFLERVDEKRYL